MTLQPNPLSLTLADPVPELEKLLDTVPPVFPIEGFLAASEVLPDDYLHDPFAPGRVLHTSVVDDGTVYLRVWTQGPFPDEKFREVRFGRQPDERVLVTRLVDENLDKA